jgi:hypothetical protein
MKFEQFVKRIAPLVMIGMGTSLSGCDGMKINMGGGDGVALAELDMSGPAPVQLALASGDTVILTEGETLTITVDGDENSSKDLRFTRKDGSLGIARSSALFGKDGPVTIRITMAAPSELVIGGSGTIEAATLASKAELVIGGSGTIAVDKIAAEKLEIAIGGNGTVKGAGSAERLEITIGGSGDVDLAGLKADRAEITIGGSGNVAFASDGTVEASIAGSGDITVTGSAKCTAKSFGSGTLNCKPAE